MTVDRNVLGIIQARMGSERLPGKVLASVGDRSILQWVIDRAGMSRLLDTLVVATGDLQANRPIMELCHARDVPVFAGSESDVLSRFASCAQEMSATHVVRLTADNPFITASVIDDVVGHMLECGPGVDYVANNWPVRKQPIGIEVESMPVETLFRASMIVDNARDREHVTSYIRRNPASFRISTPDISEDHPHISLTIDTPEDLNMANQIASGFVGREPTLAQIIQAALDSAKVGVLAD